MYAIEIFTHVSISSQSGASAQKIDVVEILFCTEMGKYIQFGAQCCQKYASYQESFK